LAVRQAVLAGRLWPWELLQIMMHALAGKNLVQHEDYSAPV
jgi:hypothetical protein